MEHSWKVPPFVLRGQKVVLPKINGSQFSEMKENEVNGREIDFVNSP